jgi:peptidoglycan/xylan/chitin deacetylase (PgdA/CDA1 family)
VYSITYDEGCAALLEHALPLHRRYGIPGHVAMVASQVGVPRNCPGSSYDGMMILSADQIRMLCNEGWGVSCHSMTHVATTDANARIEVVQSRNVLEQALGMPISVYCVPGTMHSYPAARAVAQQAGYRAILTIHDAVNSPDTDLMYLHRVPLHSQYPGPFFSEFDPYKRIHQAMDLGGWIIDYCHCPTPDKPIHPAKDCTSQQLEQRIATHWAIGYFETHYGDTLLRGDFVRACGELPPPERGV